MKFLRALNEPSLHRGGSLNKNKNKNPLFAEWFIPLHKKDLKALEKITHTFEQRWLLDMTPLMIACAIGDISIVKWMLNYGSVEDTDFMNRNALYYAIQSGNTQIVQLLLKHQIDMFVQDTNGHMVVDYFCMNDIEKHLQDPTYKIDTSYRSIVLNTLYKMGAKANPLIERFYAKTGRLTEPREHKRYKAYLLELSKRAHPSGVPHMEISQPNPIAVYGGKNRT